MRASRAVVTATLLLASFAGGGAIAQAETGRTWELTSQYVIEVDHFPLEDAAIYQAQGRSALLLVDQSLGKPLLMELRVREVKPVDESAFTYGPDRRTLTMPDDFSSTVTIPYTFKGGGAIFYLGDRRVRVGTKPPLIGEATVEQILAHSPSYKDGMDQYIPSSPDIDYLRKVGRDVRIEVFFGSWCPHCREIVPQFLKSIQSIGNHGFEVTLTGVPHPPFDAYAPAREKGIRGVPTFIVYRGDEELGRFSSFSGESSVEHEIVLILTDKKRSS